MCREEKRKSSAKRSRSHSRKEERKKDQGVKKSQNINQELILFVLATLEPLML